MRARVAIDEWDALNDRGDDSFLYARERHIACHAQRFQLDRGVIHRVALRERALETLRDLRAELLVRHEPTGDRASVRELQREVRMPRDRVVIIEVGRLA